MQRRHPLIPCILAVALATAGCGTTKGAATTSQAVASDVANADISASLRAVPAEAAVVVSMSSPSTFWAMASGKDFIAVDPEIAKELHTSLKAHVDKHLGLDFTSLRSMIVFGGGEPIQAAAVFTPVRGTLRMGQDIEGGKMIVLDNDEGIVAIHSGETLLLGQKDAALLGLAALRDPKRAMTGAFKDLVEAQVQNADLSATGSISALHMPAHPLVEGLQYAALRFVDGKIVGTLKGNNETLKALETQLDALLTLTTLQLKRAMEESESDLVAGAGAIMSYYSTKNIAKILKPRIDGETLTLDIEMGFGSANGMIIVSVIGVLAAVAIPAFMKYIKKSKTSEAVVFLRKLNDGALAAQAEGTLPEVNVGPTPPLGSCCTGPDGEKCMPNEADWQHPTWQALDFAMRDPHYYSYEFRRQGDGFEVLAYGDLDCDQVSSTFRMRSVDGSYVDKSNELE